MRPWKNTSDRELANMITWGFVALGVVLCALGACTGCSEPLDTVTVTTGTAEQATTYQIDNDYGIRADITRCHHIPTNFAGGICAMPSGTKRSWSVNWVSGSSLLEIMNAKAAIKDAALQIRWESDLVTPRYQQWVFTQLADQSGVGNIRIHLGCWGLPPGTLGRTDNGVFFGTGIKHYDVSNVLIDLCNIHATQAAGHLNGTQFTTSEKSHIYYNAVKHEIGHALGLGHVSGNCTMMATVPNVECWTGIGLFEDHDIDVIGTFMIL